MASECDIQKIRSFFAADRFAAEAGVTIDEVSAEHVECGLLISPRHLNAAGSVQGGAIFTLADLAFAVHSNLELALGGETGVTVGQSNSISYLRAPKGQKLIARSACLSRGRHVSVYRVDIMDDLGNAVAVMIGNGFTKQN
ncbi:MAG: PaaI family thioesterase [Gracilibacteraceae bacterium]|jgi:acyl-CoA thioesterase|nr:PaaI family thioesterase [Gracilibacteraceae bacterium]